VVLLVFLVPILIGAFLLAMEQLEYELLVRRPRTFTGSPRTDDPPRRCRECRYARYELPAAPCEPASRRQSAVGVCTQP
jgi:hypothetical protein